MIKFNVLNRFSGAVQFTAEIDCAEGELTRIKMGLAVRWAYKSGADLRGAVLRGADLRGAVLRGAVLRGADLRGADLRGAVLSDADLSGAVLRGAVLRGADLSGADLRGAVLSDADLSGADLSGAVLSGADDKLKGIPRVENIDAKILDAITAGGKLDMGSWHKCGTTHCRAGWAITLAGEGGAALEFALGPAAAGALIYAASRPGKPVPDFYCDNAKALADIKASAEEARAA